MKDLFLTDDCLSSEEDNRQKMKSWGGNCGMSVRMEGFKEDETVEEQRNGRI